MFLHLKIAVCVPKIPTGRKKIKIPIRLKITIISKNCRLKITVESKNCGASVGKPSGVVQVFRTSAKDCRQHRTQSRRATKGEPERVQEHTTTEGEQESNKQTNFLFYI